MAVDYDSKSYLEKVDAWWRATTYLSGGMIFLKNNPLFSVTNTPIQKDDIKVKPIGHWGTISGQTFLYAHANRLINKYGLNMFYIGGPGHGGQVMVTNSYLDGTYTDAYPEITQDLEGMSRLYKRFSFPGGIGSHMTAQTPGSLHEGGELGYSLSHGTGAILDNPDVIAAVEIGDGESETGPLATSWFSDKFINPIKDGAVLPIINMNGFKISNPTILSRMSDEDLTSYFKGMGWDPEFVEVKNPDDHEPVHEDMAKAMDKAIEKIKAIQKNARENNDNSLPNWPMIIFRSPKGWTGPKEDFDGNPVEGSFRAHQVPLPIAAGSMEHADQLVSWLKSYKPEDFFNEDGTIKQSVRDMAPKGEQRMAMNPITNGGIKPEPLKLPDYKKYAIKVKTPGAITAQDMIVWSDWVADTMKLNPTNFRAFGPDETKSNRLYSMLDTGKRQWEEPIKEPNDENMAPQGRVIDSQLSEHQAEGWLEGYVLTGRHGFFATYESFGRVVDSMLTQHMKWLRKASEQQWRKQYPSLNFVDTSTVFQQDHNGYTHQDPGMLTHLYEKKPELIREYLPGDANTLLAVADVAFRSYQTINLLVTSKHPRPQWFSIDEATNLVHNGLGYIDWASTDQGQEPDVVFAAAGSEPTWEVFAAVSLLHEAFPELKMRVINVVDLLRLRSPKKDPRGLSDEEFDRYFTTDKPVIFAFHGYEDLVRDMFFDRHNHNVHVHGYRENGDITTPFDMRVLNQLDRFDLAKEAVSDIPAYAVKGAYFIQRMDDMVAKHTAYIREVGTDLPEVNNWQWKPLK